MPSVRPQAAVLEGKEEGLLGVESAGSGTPGWWVARGCHCCDCDGGSTSVGWRLLHPAEGEER